jgi:hypothetical protein
MADVLTTRDGLIGNSPRYTGYISPPYKRYLKDDAGNAINLTGVAPGAFSITFVNQSNPLLVKTGGGTFTIVSPATQGLVSYQYAEEDLADAGNWYAFWTVQLPGEPSPRAFDPDFLSIVAFPGGLPIVTIQQVDLEQLGGTQISSSNPVPVSGPITAADGGIVALGTTTDSSNASTTIGLLKAIKAYLAGTLTTSGTVTETNSAAILADANSIVTATNNASTAIGTVGDAAWSGSGNGTEIAILKKLVAELAATLNVSVVSALPAGTNVIGHVVVDSAGSVSVTSLPSIPTGSNTIGSVNLNAGTNLIGGIQQADLTATGTISAAQPSINTPVSNATVTLAVGQGQSTWKAQLLAGGGGFTSATTIVADKSPDGGTTWYSASFKVSGANPNTSVSSVVGPGPLELTGNAAGVSHVRIRCSILNSTETIAVTLRGGAGVAEIGLMSPVPAGTNTIGAVTQASGPWTQNLTQVNGTALSNTNPVPSQDIEQSGYVTASSPPSQTNAGSDTPYTFSSQVNRLIIQNNTSANLNYAFDTAASAGSFLLVPGATLVYPKKCTVLHLYTAVAQNINGTAAGNIVVLGAL